MRRLELGMCTLMRALMCLTPIAFGGCAHIDVQDMGSGQHSLTAVSASGGFYGSHEEAVERANDFCRRSGQQAVIDGFFDKSASGPNGEHTSSVIFNCAAPQHLQF
jgi:hypothetical protein